MKAVLGEMEKTNELKAKDQHHSLFIDVEEIACREFDETAALNQCKMEVGRLRVATNARTAANSSAEGLKRFKHRTLACRTTRSVS